MKKNYIYIVCILIVLLVVVGFIVLNPFKSNSKNDIKNIETELTKIGKEYYTNFYYPAFNNPEGLKAFSESGLSINLDNLKITNPFDEKLEKLLKRQNCSYADTKVIITPTAPFGKDNYKIEILLSCN